MQTTLGQSKGLVQVVKTVPCQPWPAAAPLTMRTASGSANAWSLWSKSFQAAGGRKGRGGVIRQQGGRKAKSRGNRSLGAKKNFPTNPNCTPKQHQIHWCWVPVVWLVRADAELPMNTCTSSPQEVLNALFELMDLHWPKLHQPLYRWMPQKKGDRPGMLAAST